MISTKEMYESTYGEKYTVQITNLNNQITQKESGIDTYRVINIEAGLGKSVETNKIIKEYLESYEFGGENCGEEHRKFLIVKRFSKDVVEAEMDIGEELNIGSIQKVVGITGENWMDDWKFKPDALIQADVIIITHARYVLLCSREEEQAMFTQDRHTLIIDERIDFTKYSFSKKGYDEMLHILPFGLHGSLIDVSRPLFNEMLRVKEATDTKKGTKLFNNHIMRTKKPSKNLHLLKIFKSLIGENLPKIHREQGEKVADKVRDFTNALEVLYSADGYFNNGTITTCNHEQNLWSLENNIILDANGAIEKLYKSSDKWGVNFILDRQGLIVEHSKSTLTHIKFNSSKNKIEELDKEPENEYYSQIVSLIKEEYKKGFRLLLVMQKQFILTNQGEGSFVRYLREQGMDDIIIGAEEVSRTHGNQKIAINWFGNLIGKNDWRDFDQCWILGTPNIPMETHVINMAQYSKKYDWRLGLEMIRKNKDKYIFKNEVYEEIRKGYLVGEIYQAIKRVQRNAAPKAKYFIVNNDEDVVKGVSGLLKNVKVEEQITLEIKKKEKNISPRTEPSESEITMRIIMSILSEAKGEYMKGQLCDRLGIEKSNLNKYFNKKNALVKSYIDSGDIEISHHKVIRL